MADSVAWVRPMRVLPAPVSAAVNMTVYMHIMGMLIMIVNLVF